MVESGERERRRRELARAKERNSQSQRPRTALLHLVTDTPDPFPALRARLTNENKAREPPFGLEPLSPMRALARSSRGGPPRLCRGFLPTVRTGPAPRPAAIAAASSGRSPSPSSSPKPPPTPTPPPTLLARSPSPSPQPSSSSSWSARLREIEVLHARFAMLGTSAVVLSDWPVDLSRRGAEQAARRITAVLDGVTGGAGASVACAALLMLALAETARVTGERDAERRAYPAATARGNALFDPLGIFRVAASSSSLLSPSPPPAPPPPPSLEEASRAVYGPWLRLSSALLSSSSSSSPSLSRRGVGQRAGGRLRTSNNNKNHPQGLTRAELAALQARELAAGRVAMSAFAGVAAASGLTGRGPVTLLLEHLADPGNATVLTTLVEAGARGGHLGVGG